MWCIFLKCFTFVGCLYTEEVKVIYSIVRVHGNQVHNTLSIGQFYEITILKSLSQFNCLSKYIVGGIV